MFCRATSYVLALLAASCLLAAPNPAAADSFTVITNNVPPFKFIEDGELSGMAGDLLKTLFQATGHTVGRTRIMSMSRYLAEAYREPGTVFLALSKSHERGHGLKWVGPIFTAGSGIIVKKARDLRLARIQDARGMTLASVIHSAPEDALMGKAIGEKHFLRFATPGEAVRALADDRADGLLLATAAAYRRMRLDGIDPDLYHTALTLESIPLYFAFSPQTPDSVVNELQAALERMKRPDAKGMSPYLAIVSRYY